MNNSQLGQRERAEAVLRQAPRGSVGAAIRPMMEEAIRRLGLLGDANVAAGSIGDFYERNRELLYRPATDKNIEKFARRETKHLRNERDWLAWAAGYLLSAQDRARFIKEERDKLLGASRSPHMKFDRFDAMFNQPPPGSRFGFGPHGTPIRGFGSQGGFPTFGIGSSGLTSFGLNGFNMGLSPSSIGVGSIGSSGLTSFGLNGFNMGLSPSSIGVGSIGSSGLTSFGLGGFSTGTSTSSTGIGSIGSSGFGLGGFSTGTSTSSTGIGSIGSSGFTSFGLGGFSTGTNTSSGGSPSTGGFNGSGK
ncbi:hypothetical protein [Stigmatella aurantiaca]|nr:hypothetical protein [Stigmatella aurantiaca]